MAPVERRRNDSCSGRVGTRPEQLSDQSLLFELFKHSRLPMLAGASLSEAQLTQLLRSQFDIQTRHYQQAYPDPEFFILEWQNQPVGRLYLAHLPNEIRLIDIALLPSFQGQGIGSQVLIDLISTYSSQSKPISLHVEKQNPALHLYLRLGFKIVADRELYWFMCTEIPNT